MPTNYKTIINFRDGVQVDENDLVSVGGLVGIGTTIPRETLDVRGNVIVENETNLRHVNVIGFATHYGNINVAVGYSVGIGTTVPEASFQVGVGTTGATITAEGRITATSFVGDGSALTNLPTSVWNNDNPGAGSTIYAFRPVGVSVTFPTADFGVGDLILMDAISGVSTFQEVEAKEINLVGNAQQGNINMTGTISGIQSITNGTGNFETTGVGSFGKLDIATGIITGGATGLIVTGIEKKITFLASSSNTDQRHGISFRENSSTPDVISVLYNGSSLSTQGNPSGQLEVWGRHGDLGSFLPRVVISREANVGIGTTRVGSEYQLQVVGAASTFSGSVGASGGFIGDVIGDITGVAGLSEGLTGVPDISVDKIDSLGINSIFIRNTGVSTFGGELKVGNFVGVGETTSALGKGLGVIGGGDISGALSVGGDLDVAGGLTIGGTFTGAVNVSDVTAGEIIATGILSATTTSSAVLHDTTITGNVTQESGKDFTIGKDVSIGGTVTLLGDTIKLGTNNVVSIAGSFDANTTGVVTTTKVVCQDLVVNGNLDYRGGAIATFGKITLDGTTGFISCTGDIDATGGIITCRALDSKLGIITCGGITLNGGSIGSCSNIAAGTGIITCGGLFLNNGRLVDGGDADFQTGVVTCGELNVRSGGGGIFSGPVYSKSGVSTFFNIDVGGGDSNLIVNRIGFNTALTDFDIFEGIGLYDDAEIFSHPLSNGIGIGSTSGQRGGNVTLYNGYGRDNNGDFTGGCSVFEGGVAIGTHSEPQEENFFEVYKTTVFHETSAGAGGTGAYLRIGIGTAEPRTTLDMSNAKGGYIAMPVYSGALSLESETVRGSIFFDEADNQMKVIDNNLNVVGVQTVLDFAQDVGEYAVHLGFVGGVTNSDATRGSDLNNTVDNEVQPANTGLGTAHMVYNKQYNKHQYATQQGTNAFDASIFRSYVSSGTSALNIELDSTGTKVFITIAGVGSATLNLV